MARRWTGRRTRRGEGCGDEVERSDHYEQRRTSGRLHGHRQQHPSVRYPCRKIYTRIFTLVPPPTRLSQPLPKAPSKNVSAETLGRGHVRDLEQGENPSA